MNKIRIKDLKKFSAPLDAIKNSIPSVIFTKNDGTFHVNLKSEDGSKLVNLRYHPETVVVNSSSEDGEQLGIYNLDEFIGILTMFDQKLLDINKEENKIRIVYNDSSEVSYVLSDIQVIMDIEGPAESKKSIDFLVEFKLDKEFFKKVRKIANKINGRILNFIMEDGELSFTVGEEYDHTNHYKEHLISGCDSENFDVSIPFKTEDGKDNFAFICDQYPYQISIHPRVIMMVAETNDYDLLRYYIAPNRE